MKKSDVIKLIGVLSAAYPNMKEVNEAMVEIWFECLKDIDIEVALVGVKKNILESPYPPSISDIRKQVGEVLTPIEENINGSESWGEVMSAIRRFGYNRQIEALESMSGVTRKVVKYMGWQEMCHSEKPDVVRGQFLKMFEMVLAREKQSRILPTGFLEDVNKLKSRSEELSKLSEGIGKVI